MRPTSVSLTSVPVGSVPVTSLPPTSRLPACVRRAPAPWPRALLLGAAVTVLTSCAGGGAATTASATVRAAAPVALDAVPYRVAGPRTLTVGVPVGGGCTPAGSADVEVAETATSVTVRASVRPAPAPAQDVPEGTPCPAVLRTMPVTVALAAPLGARTVVDGVGGRVVPPGAWPGLAGERSAAGGPALPLPRLR